VYVISSKDVMRTLSWTKLLLMELPNKAIIPIGRFWVKFILMFNMNILPWGGDGGRWTSIFMKTTLIYRIKCAFTLGPLTPS
jgi:hypothetical protein